MIASTNLFGVMLGVNPEKKDGDNTWLNDQRSDDWVKNLLKNCTVPEYVSGGSVNLEGDDNAAASASSSAGGNPAKGRQWITYSVSEP
jgi:hypothetical protein